MLRECVHPPQEAGVQEVKREMEVELYDIEAIKRQLGDILDEFISDLGYVRDCHVIFECA